MMKNFKKFAIVALGSAIILSCSKKDDNPAPISLSKTDASTALVVSTAEFEALNSDYKDATTITGQAMSALSSLGGGRSTSDFYIGIGSFRKNSDKEEEDMVNQVAINLGELSFAPFKSAPNARIPRDFDSAKGIWAYSVVGYSGSFVKIAASEKIVLQFPSKHSYSDYGKVLVNDAEYTISQYKTGLITRTTCLNGAPKEYLDTTVTALVAELTVKGEKQFSIDLSNTIVNNVSTSYSSKYVIKNFEYSYTHSTSGNTYTFYYGWKKEGKIVSESASQISYISISAIDDYRCSNSNPYYLGITNIQSGNGSSTRGSLKLSYYLGDVTAYKNEIKTKYNLSSLDAELDSATYYKVLKDTAISDKYIKYTLSRTSDNAKLGDIVARYETVTDGTPPNSNSYYSTSVYYIVYADGSKERLRDKFRYFEYYYGHY